MAADLAATAAAAGGESPRRPRGNCGLPPGRMALITSDCGLDQARWRPVSSGCRRMRRMRCLSTRCLLPFRGCCVHGRVMRRPALLVAARCDRPPIVNAAVVDCPPAEWPWSPRICVQSGQVRDRPWPCRAPPGAATDGALSHTTHTQVVMVHTHKVSWCQVSWYTHTSCTLAQFIDP